MKKQKFRSQYNFKREPERLDKGSMTVPGESLTIRQLFARHKAGIIDGVKLQGEYDEDEEFIPPDRQQLDHYDLTSIDEAQEFVNQQKQKAEASRKRKEALKKSATKEERTTTERSDDVEADDNKKPSSVTTETDE